MTDWILQKGKKKHRVLTKDSKNLQDAKEYEPSNFYSKFSAKRIFTEFYCKPHMKDRLKEYCNQDALIDIVFAGTNIEISNYTDSFRYCHVKDCKTETKFKLVRNLF